MAATRRPEAGFRLRRHRALPAELRRVALAQLDRAVTETQGDDVDTAVHDARRRTKKIRALVKLLRPLVPDDAVRDNLALRDAARRVADFRDATATLATFNGLSERFPDDLSAVAGPAREALEHRRTAVDDQSIGLHLARMRGDLEVLRARVVAWEIPDHGFDTVAPGLRRSYRQARRRMHDAHDTGATAARHEWRKRVKDHRYQVSLLRACWPRLMRARAAALHDLTDLLGDDHDLAVLHDLLAADPSAYGGVEVVARVAVHVDERRAALQREAVVLGARCFAEPPDRLVARFREYWDAAEEDGQVLVDDGS